MYPKMSLEEFRDIKRRVNEVVEEATKYMDNHSDDPTFDEDEYEKEAVVKLVTVLREFEKRDLSEIPFEEWDNIEMDIPEGEVFDLSNTHANIDLDIFHAYGEVNFKGCNVINLDKQYKTPRPELLDDELVARNPDLFISDDFSDDFKEKFYNNQLTMDDLITINDEQLRRLSEKKSKKYIRFDEYNELLIQALGLIKTVEIYKYSKDDYKAITSMLNPGWVPYKFETIPQQVSRSFLESIKDHDIQNIVEEIYSFLREQYIQLRLHTDVPKEFIDRNPDLFLINVDVPTDVKEKFLTRSLDIPEIINYGYLFENIPLDSFIDDKRVYLIDYFTKHGIGSFQKLVAKHPRFFTEIYNRDLSYTLGNLLKSIDYKDPETTLIECIKVGVPIGTYSRENLEEFNFKYIEKINNLDELMSMDRNTIVLDKDQAVVVNQLGIENIQQFEKETGFFSIKGEYSYTREMETFNALSSIFRYQSSFSSNFNNIDFNHGKLSYDMFRREMAKSIDIMRKRHFFRDIPDYRSIEGKFREDFPKIFIDKSAPDELQRLFYHYTLNAGTLYNHPEYIEWLIHVDIEDAMELKANLQVPGLVDENGNIVVSNRNFFEFYSEKFGKEETYNLIVKYGHIIDGISVTLGKNEEDNKSLIEKAVRKRIYEKVKSSDVNFSFLKNVPEMCAEYPEMFIDIDAYDLNQSEKNALGLFYTKKMTIDSIRKYPRLAEIIKDKDLFIAFGQYNGKREDGRIVKESNNYHAEAKYSILEFLEVLGNEKFLELCAKYGKYFEDAADPLLQKIDMVDGKFYRATDAHLLNPLSYEDIIIELERTIARECRLGNIQYTEEDSPEFLRANCPDMFIDPNAPRELRWYFYNYCNNYPLSFEVLHNHKEWMPYLKDKAIKTSLLRRSYLKSRLIQYFNLFGDEKGIRLGISRGKVVEQMLVADKVNLMKDWYDKTGGKFIPDNVVMLNIPIEEADKFLTSAQNWSTLVRSSNFGKTEEGKDALLKLAYSFGAFDGDNKGFKDLLDLITSIPTRIPQSKEHILEQLDHEISFYSQKDLAIQMIQNEELSSKEETQTRIYEKIIEFIKNNKFQKTINDTILLNLIQAIKLEMPDFEFDKPIMKTFYKMHENGYYTLTINQQRYPKITAALRECISLFPDSPVISDSKAHQLFGGFNLTYDPDFRRFLLKNLDEILNNPEYTTYIASIQKQFGEIKTMNSNRVLTLELAISYIQTNKYTNVNTGNERVSEISSIAGYTQEDFDTLQQIFNYGKQRTFSSIPRIESTTEKKSGKYVFEMLRLDDPLAMAIGTLTDCCQEINNCAEVCMEHSMVDKHGRVFVIRDLDGNIIAQSWVWRNKDVLCFDNIEIPDKAFTRIEKENPNIGKSGFAEEIYEIYKEAAQLLIEEDERVYKALLDEGKITKEEYDGLRLGKVTVGLGYNDIASALKGNAKLDEEIVSSPIHFEEPVRLSRGLYTSDSRTQYVLEKRDDRKAYDGETITVHSDTFIEYTDNNFTLKNLFALEKLERATKEKENDLEIYAEDYVKEENIVSSLGRNYRLSPENTRIVMNPNFAIIYEVNNDEVRVGELLYNLRVDNNAQQMDITNVVIMQLRLALNQIGSGKTINTNYLNLEQQEIINKAIALDGEIDIERGVSHGR